MFRIRGQTASMPHLPFWPSSFQSKSNFRQLAKDCPGTMSGKGKPLSAAVVTAKVQKTEKDFWLLSLRGERPLML
jgi:hypothetical protein